MNPAHRDMDEVAEFATGLNTREGFHRIDFCTGPCKQGRIDCPCPESCQVSIEDQHAGWGAVVIPFYIVLGVAGLALLAHVLAGVFA